MPLDNQKDENNRIARLLRIQQEDNEIAKSLLPIITTKSKNKKIMRNDKNMIFKTPNLFEHTQNYCAFYNVELPKFYWEVIAQASGSNEIPQIVNSPRQIGKTLFNKILHHFSTFNIPPFCIFDTDGFLSKWGFFDGDILDHDPHITNWIGYSQKWVDINNETHYIDDRFFFAFLMVKYVIHRIKDAKFSLTHTHHNPIRIDIYKGEDIDHYDSSKYDDNPIDEKEFQIPLNLIIHDFKSHYLKIDNIWSEMTQKIANVNKQNGY